VRAAFDQSARNAPRDSFTQRIVVPRAAAWLPASGGQLPAASPRVCRQQRL